MSFDKKANYIIDKVYVKKLWNKYDISCKFDKDINIFIGINGSYKTTFIMLIYNLLTLDFVKLIDIDFQQIELKICKGRSYKYIQFSKEYNEDNEKQYVFEIKGFDKICLSERELKMYGNALFDNDDDYENNYRADNKSGDILKSKYSRLKDKLEQYINVDYLNINRYTLIKRKPFFYPDSNENSIDAEIKKLVRQFIRYQSEIKTSINNFSNQFLMKSFENLLSNTQYNGKISFSSNEINKYKNLMENIAHNESFSGVNLNDAINRIDDTDKLVKKVIKNLQKNNKSTKSISVNEMMTSLEGKEVSKLLSNVSIFPKLQAMFDLYKVLEAERLQIEEPTKIFMEICNTFLKSTLFPEKKIIVADDGSLMLQIYEGNVVHLSRLSSGEKQLVILLLRTLLQKGEKGIYITDEPELSLHISWQEKLINALNRINPNIQLIVATHSPDIVSKYEKHIKQMEDILSNE